MSASSGSFIRRVLIVCATTVGMAALALGVWKAVHILLVVFAGILLGVLLSGLADLLSSRSGLSRGSSLVVTVLAIIAAAALIGIVLGPAAGSQIDEMSQTLPQSVDRLREYLGKYGWTRQLLEAAPEPDAVVEQATGMLSTTLSALVDLVVLVFVGLYLAADPTVYRRGLVSLIPPAHRPRAGKIIEEIGQTLRWWLVGRFTSMLIVGIMTTIGLLLLGIPLAFGLGLFAAAVTFVPYIGPMVSFIPAALLALMQSSVTVAYVGLLYLMIQLIESYLLTPLVERHAVELPPAFLITMQVLLGALLGGLGLALATPLAAVGVVLVRTLYVEGALEAKG